MKVAIIGTRGVPANYGGFETLVENIIGNNCSKGIEYTVFCSSKNYQQQLAQYKGAKLEYIALEANGIHSIIYDIVSILKAIRVADTLLILGVSGCLVLPIIRLFSKKNIIVNIDGLEHRRDKWSTPVRKFLKISEKIAVRNANIIVTDNKGIQDYVHREYNIDSQLITYGGDHVLCDIIEEESHILEKYELTNLDYCFSLCRIEPENNVHKILEAFAISGKHLIFVGNWQNSEYGKQLWTKYAVYANIRMLTPIYDLKTLNVLRKNCLFYIHGHSAGGTNPSLVEAMFFNKPIIAYDCIYNRETTENTANYFADINELYQLINNTAADYHLNAESMGAIANRRYRWSIIAAQYEKLYK